MLHIRVNKTKISHTIIEKMQKNVFAKFRFFYFSLGYLLSNSLETPTVTKHYSNLHVKKSMTTYLFINEFLRKPRSQPDGPLNRATARSRPCVWEQATMLCPVPFKTSIPVWILRARQLHYFDFSGAAFVITKDREQYGCSQGGQTGNGL